ncbi:MAG: hypothetical protein P1U89_17615 [Verrucomicrobiales bacterium]|nr:hypothetical protein [Verrucomicrobiales bacterium]
MKDPTENEAGPVAIIAVHGVADQSKDETAVKAVNLLLHLDGLEPEMGQEHVGQAYEGFKEEKIHVGINPLDISSMTDDDAWHYQLRKHLQDYQSDERKEVFETLRMEGERIVRDTPDSEHKVDRKVHIYEMHWADVSNLKLGILNLFVAIYRLLFEASWLGKQTIGKWATFGDDVGKMSTVTSLRGLMLVFHSITTVILTRFMPVIYLLMILMLMLTGIPVLESSWAEGIMNAMGGYTGLFTLSIVVLIGGGLIGLAFLFWRRLPWPPIYLVIVGICFLIGNVTLALLHGSEGSWWAESGLAIVIWIGICILMNAFVLPLLNRAFPGTRIVGNLLLLFFTVGLIFGLTHESEWPLLISGPLQALRFGSALLPLAWIILATSANLFLILAMFELFILRIRPGMDKEVRQRRKSRLRTGVLSITLPVLLISFLNATFFQLVLIPAKLGGLDGVHPVPGRSSDAPAAMHQIEEKLHEYVEPFVSRMTSVPDFESWSKENSGPRSVFSDYATYTSKEMVIPFLEFIFLIIVFVLGYTLWIVTPAVLAERNQPVNPGGKKWDKLSMALGRNLTQGYKWIWLGQVILVGCLLLTQFLFAYRGIRAGQIRASGDSTVDSAPMMVLVDQFLGLQNTETKLASTSSNRDYSRSRRVRSFGEETPQSERPHSHTHRDSSFRRDKVRESIKEMWSKREREEQGNFTPRNRPGSDNQPSFSPSTRSANPSPASTRTPISAESNPPDVIIALLTETVVFLNNGPLTSALGISILVLGIGYIFFSRLTDPLVAGLRGGLDIALDVVSYLHPFPRNRTARAQILSRYASLLQYIVEWRDPQNPNVGYSRLVILTHSQGGVITSDILRALSAGTVAKDNGLEALCATPEGKEGCIPVRLLSMGSPLVQLYNARFPDLYAWDRKADPRDTHRGLECWWNLYRSGDYVGRMIFREPYDKTNFIPEWDYVMVRDGKYVPVRETCIGAGAHTHYWDKNAPPSVVRKLDCLIACDNVDQLAHTHDEEDDTVETDDTTPVQPVI